MMPHLLPISTLLAGVALLLLGSGLLTTLITLRGNLEGFGGGMLGLIGSAYFVGFVLGTFVVPTLIRRIGHIRAFAFFAAAIAACVLLHALFVEVWVWMLLRLITGIGLVGFYTVIESWLNGEAPAERRTQIFAVYMAVNLFALAGGQQFLRLDSPASFTLFVVAAIFVVVALMPVVATRLPQPTLHDTPRLSLATVWQSAPAGFVGGAASGLVMGAFWGLGPLYAAQIGLGESEVALFVTVAILAGALLQWPMGRLSDRADRRRALALFAAIGAGGGVLLAVLAPFGTLSIVGAAVFGGGAFALYPVVIAHLIDHLPRENVLSGNAALLLLHGLGAALGPALAGAAMSLAGAVALPLFFVLVLVPTAGFALLQSRRGADEIVEEPAQFMPMLRTSETVLEMMTPEQAPGTDGEAEEAGRIDEPQDEDGTRRTAPPGAVSSPG